MKLPLKHQIAAGFGVALCILILILAAAIWNAVRFEATFERVDRTHAVLNEVERVLTGVLSMQTSARGYVLTGSEEVLAPFAEGHRTSHAAWVRLRSFTRDNPAQQKRLDELGPLISEVAAVLNQRIDARRQMGIAAAQDTSAILRSQRIVEQARRVISELGTEEQHLLREHMADTQAAARGTIGASVACGITALTFVAVSALMVRRDYRERMRSQVALQQSKAMFERLFDNAPDATIQVNRHGQIVRANKQAEALFGWPPQTLAGQAIERLLPETTAARHAGHLAAYFAAPRTRPMGAGLELFGRRRDGGEFPVDIMLSPLETAGELQALAVIRDVTDRRAIEEKIRRLNRDLQLQNSRLESANSELEAFSYSVSHDLRAPLRHIDGFAGLLSKHAAENLDEKSQRFIAIISDAAQRMGRLIDDLLTFSRMSRAQLQATEIDQDQLVASVMRDSALDRNLRIEWSIAPLPRVRGDAAMLRQVWVNLLDNAVKYSANSNPPRIEVGSQPDTETPGGHIFYVRDNGVGFDMKYAAKLFGVFQRLHSEAEFQGTGIGLANVRRVISRHGGRTWADSTLGAGATFYFTLPPAPPPPGVQS